MSKNEHAPGMCLSCQRLELYTDTFPLWKFTIHGHSWCNMISNTTATALCYENCRRTVTLMTELQIISVVSKTAGKPLHAPERNTNLLKSTRQR